MTLADFLEWEDRQELKYEFDGFQPVAMTGGTRAHAAIQGNLAVALKTRLRGKPCQFFGNDLKIEVSGSVRYPDGFVTCTPGAPGDKVARDPVVIGHILGPESILQMPEIEVDVPLAEFYEGVEFPSPETREARA